MTTDDTNNVENMNEEPPRTFQWGRFLAWTAVLALLTVIAIQLREAQQGPVMKGEPAPYIEVTTFDGDVITSADLEGKVVVINFWASWCKPCEQEAEELQTAWEMYEPRGDVVFLGVDYVDTDTPARAYMEKFQITYPSGPDLGTRMSQAFGIRGVPETYIIDREGKLSFVKIGPFISLFEITSAIDPLLGQ